MSTDSEEASRIAVSRDDGGPATVFEHLWTPYRMAYIRGEGKPTGAHDCPFCLIPQMDDEEGLVVARGEHVFAVLNLYPYNAGHLMLVPYRHVPDYTDLTAAEVAELGEFTQTAMRVVRAVSFRFRDGSQHNGVPVDQAVAAIAQWVDSRANVDPTADSVVSGRTVAG